MSYDSRLDTQNHIAEVAERLQLVVDQLQARARVHDKSKLAEPEKSVFDKVTPRLKELTFGSQEYEASLAEMGPALDHHYANNSHHPQYYDAGVHGMSLLDVIEMLCDWDAAVKRHADGSLVNSFEVNQRRFGYCSLLDDLLKNTAIELGFVTAEEVKPGEA